MWVFTKSGFYSAIEYEPHRHPEEAEQIGAVGGSHVLVRGRVQKDIDVLAERCGSRVMCDDSADYMFRTIISRQSWADFLAQSAQDIDYGNFKSTIKDHDRHSAYMGVWSAVHSLQPRRGC